MCARIYSHTCVSLSHSHILDTHTHTQVPDPTFDSQSKDMLTTRLRVSSSSPIISPSFVKKIVDGTNIVESVVDMAMAKQRQALYRTARKVTKSKRNLLDVPKLEDAIKAAGPRSHECTLILTEGDSAKALAVAGMSVVGRDLFGVFPLKGKLLNVRDASMRTLAKNAEIQNVVNALGLDFKEKYETEESRKKLRYGHVMIMADQDHDGSHIKGLVLNMFHWFWPALLREPISTTTTKKTKSKKPFLQQFVTPLIKVREKKKKNRKKTKNKRTQKNNDKVDESISFYSEDEFNAWNAKHNTTKDKYKVKYYKGLGTSTAEEAREYFSAIKRHRISFDWGSSKDGDDIDMAFSKNRASDRRDWISTSSISVPSTTNREEDRTVTYSDFVRFIECENNNTCLHFFTRSHLLPTHTHSPFTRTHTHIVPTHKQTHTHTFQVQGELVQFSRADVLRSIPSVVDGLKPSQRKVLFACFKRKLRNEIKVAQLAGYVSEHTGYHHGEASLHATIVNMAQNFVGSNNVPLLEPIGQFGTRLQGGKDAASPRYIYTQLSPVARLLFPEADDPLLEWLEDDGDRIEPQFYVPIIPFALINGARGIGTGWSTAIPPHHPVEVVDAVKARILQGENNNNNAADKPLMPWFRGFQGNVKRSTRGVYRFEGNVSHNRLKININELPPRVWTQQYKETLASMVQDGSINSFTEDHSEAKVAFTLSV